MSRAGDADRTQALGPAQRPSALLDAVRATLARPREQGLDVVED